MFTLRVHILERLLHDLRQITDRYSNYYVCMLKYKGINSHITSILRIFYRFKKNCYCQNNQSNPLRDDTRQTK